MNYQECLNNIYSSYMHVKPFIKGKQDSVVRNVDIILSLLTDLDLIPSAEKVIKVSGSKGKGTTTRLCEKMIRYHDDSKNVAMLISPEEIEHFDRMRINGVTITPELFAEIYTELLPVLNEKKKTFEGMDYLSPSGLFLLIALTWFKRHHIDYYVLETGRGAKYDEVGNIASHVSIVTSILLEHPEYLGGSLETIAQHKLFTCNNAVYGVVADSAMEYYSDSYSAKILPIYPLTYIKNFPSWYNSNLAMALTGVSQLCRASNIDMYNSFIDADAHTSASFGHKVIGEQHFYYEPAIATDSLDLKFLKSITTKNTLFLVSLPDEKDIGGLVQTLQHYGDVKHITLTGTRGYLSYDITNRDYKNDILWTGQYDDVDGFKNSVIDMPYANIYLLGTQTYIRLVKMALFGY